MHGIDVVEHAAAQGSGFATVPASQSACGKTEKQKASRDSNNDRGAFHPSTPDPEIVSPILVCFPTQAAQLRPAQPSPTWRLFATIEKLVASFTRTRSAMNIASPANCLVDIGRAPVGQI